MKGASKARFFLVMIDNQKQSHVFFWQMVILLAILPSHVPGLRVSKLSDAFGVYEPSGFYEVKFKNVSTMAIIRQEWKHKRFVRSEIIHSGTARCSLEISRVYFCVS